MDSPRVCLRTINSLAAAGRSRVARTEAGETCRLIGWLGVDGGGAASVPAEEMSLQVH